MGGCECKCGCVWGVFGVLRHLGGRDDALPGCTAAPLVPPQLLPAVACVACILSSARTGLRLTQQTNKQQTPSLYNGILKPPIPEFSPPVCSMPLDALGTVSEGGLLGAMETGWVARRTTGAALLALALLAAARRWGWGLVGIYLGLRALNIGTLVADLPKWLSRGSPFSEGTEVYYP